MATVPTDGKCRLKICTEVVRCLALFKAVVVREGVGGDFLVGRVADRLNQGCSEMKRVVCLRWTRGFEFIPGTETARRVVGALGGGVLKGLVATVCK